MVMLWLRLCDDSCVKPWRSSCRLSSEWVAAVAPAWYFRLQAKLSGWSRRLRLSLPELMSP
jgi:hypothetical protein